MTSGELKRRLADLGISPSQLAEMRRSNVRTVQRWISGKQDIPVDMAEYLDHLKNE